MRCSLKTCRPAQLEPHLRIAQDATQNPIFCRDDFRGSIGDKLKIEFEMVQSGALKFVLDDKGGFAVSGADGSSVRHAEGKISRVRGAQEAAL